MKNHLNQLSRAWALGLTLCICMAGASLEQTTSFPNKALKIVVPNAAGGAADITARTVGQKLSEALGQPVVIENKPSAGGIVAGEQVARSDPDGHSMLLISSGTAVSASLFKTLPFDTVKDFIPVSKLATFDLVIAVAASGPLNDVKQLVEFDRANPRKLNFGAISAGSTQNLAADMFRAIIGSEATVVPYKSSPELIHALTRGDIDVGFDYLAAFAPSLADKQLKLIASGGEKRSQLTPDTPTVLESGIDYVVTSWNGVSAPAATPRELINQLNREITAVLQLPDVQERFRQLGMEAAITTPEGMDKRLEADLQRWRSVISKLGLQQETTNQR